MSPSMDGASSVRNDVRSALQHAPILVSAINPGIPEIEHLAAEYEVRAAWVTGLSVW